MDSLQVCEIAGEYGEPAGRLLRIGEPEERGSANWPDYAAEFGMTQDDTGALIRMAGDPALHGAAWDSAEVWAPVHAWRALGQLRAEAAIGPLLAILRADDDDMACEEIPVVLGMIGPAAIPALVEFLADPGTGVFPAVAALEGIKHIALIHTSWRDECVAILARTLAPGLNTFRTVQGFAVSCLIDLAAVEAIDAIRDAFARDAVDLSVAGDIEDTEIALGLRAERATPPPNLRPLLFGGRTENSMGGRPRDIAPPPRRAAVGRNEPCPCGSGKKYKKCCL